ncbi:MAG: hypothetical protein ACP5OR_08705 [Candidatus Dormibacteria bacterium]
MPISTSASNPTPEHDASSSILPQNRLFFTALVMTCGGVLFGLRSLASDSPHVPVWITVAGWAGTLLGTLVIILGHKVRFTPFRFRILRNFAILLAFGSIVVFAVRVSFGLSHTRLLSCSDDSAITVWEGGAFVRNGHNPYLTWNNPRELLTKCHVVTFTLLQTGRFARDFIQPSPQHVTPITTDILEGITPPEVLSAYFYPIGNALLGVFGSPMIIIITAFTAILLSGLILARTPQQLRGMLALTMAAQVPFWGQFGVLNAAPFAFVLLLPAWFSPSSKSSSLTAGFACAVRQLPWLSIPALAGLVWRQNGFRKGVRTGALIVLVFLAISLPFMWNIPGKWFHDVISQEMFAIPNGSGLVVLFSSRILPAVLAKYLSVLEVCTTLLAGVLALIFGRNHPEVAAVCTGLAIWVGPVSYAAHIAPVGMFAVLAYWGSQIRENRAHNLTKLQGQ